MIKQFVAGKPYFTDVAHKHTPFPYLDSDLETDVLIIGGGIDGMLCAYYFSKNNIGCTLIDESRIGHRSTSAATALLEYQLDDYFCDLTEFYSPDEAAAVYRLGLDALSDIEKIIDDIGNTCHYSEKDILVFTLKQKGVDAIVNEFEFRKRFSFDVKLVRAYNNDYPFSLKAGLYAKKGGAEFNPYLFTARLAEVCSHRGARIYENTKAEKLEKIANGFTVTTQYGSRIRCKKVIAATGYDTTLFSKKKLCQKYISYTIVTPPVNGLFWENNCLLQDDMKPYHYMRLSPDNRLILGGCDTLFLGGKINAPLAELKYKSLESFGREIFADFASKIVPEYRFCGLFSSTKNNLAVVGESEEDENLWFCLGYGANGIIYSVYGAQLLVKKYRGESDEFARFFSPKRPLP